MASMITGDRFWAVALDFDGTISDSVTHLLRPRARAAIRQLNARGMPVFILTGRRPLPLYEVADECGLTGPMVAANGACVVDAGTRQVLTERLTPPEITRSTVELGKKHGLGIAIWGPERTYADRLDEYTDLLEYTAGGEPVALVDDLATVDLSRVYKVNLFGDTDQLDAVQAEVEAEHPALRRSAIMFFDTVAPGATKWEGLLYCLEHAGISPADTLGVADGENDIDWIAAVGFGVAMGNAYPRLKEVADHEIGHVDDDAAAIFLEEVFGLEPGA